MPARPTDKNQVVVEINDFSPGIASPRADSQTRSVLKLGTATPATVGCMALPDGSIGPAFKRETSYSATPPSFTQTMGGAVSVTATLNNFSSGYRPTDAPRRWIAATSLMTPSLYLDATTAQSDYDNVDQVMLATHEYFDPANGGAYRSLATANLFYQSATGGTTWNPYASPWWWQYNSALNWASSTAVASIRQIVSDLVSGWNLMSTATAANNNVRRSIFWRAAIGGTTRSPYTGTNTWSTTAGAQGDWFTFYDPEDAISVPAYNKNLPSSNGALPNATFHQGRLVVPQNYTAATDPTKRFQSTMLVSTNFSPTSQTVLYNPSQNVVDDGISGSAITQTVLPVAGSADYGIAGLLSMNANTLFIPQVMGGATMIRGDLDRPQVTYLPSVPPTGFNFSQPVNTAKGAVYASSSGLWLWNEGNQAEQLAPNLPPKFWCTTGAEYDRAYWATRRGKLGSFGKWLFAPNDWFMDMDSGAWWKMPTKSNNLAPPYQQYECSPSGRLYAFPAYQSSTSSLYFDQYDLHTQETANAATWIWESHPFPDSLGTRNLVCREVSVVASGTGTLGVYVVGGNSASTSATLTITGTATGYPQAFRATMAAHTRDATRGTTWGASLGLVATGDGTGPLPTVHSIQMVFDTRESVERAN